MVMSPQVSWLFFKARASESADAASAQLYLVTADSWRSQLERWTVTQNGPWRPLPYYVRLTKDGNPNAGTTYSLGNGGPNSMDQRAVADTGFLELIRLGIKPASDRVIINSLQVLGRLALRPPTAFSALATTTTDT